jgi:hypothetical protein
MRRLDTEGIAYLQLSGTGGLVAPLHLAWRDVGLSGVVRRLINQVRQQVKQMAR